MLKANFTDRSQARIDRLFIILQIHRLDLDAGPQRLAPLLDHGLELVVQATDAGVLLALQAAHLGGVALGLARRRAGSLVHRRRRARSREDGPLAAQARHDGGTAAEGGCGGPARDSAGEIGGGRAGFAVVILVDEHPVVAVGFVAAIAGVVLGELAGDGRIVSHMGSENIILLDSCRRRRRLPAALALALALVGGRGRVGAHLVCAAAAGIEASKGAGPAEIPDLADDVEHGTAPAGDRRPLGLVSILVSLCTDV